jgi:transposase
MDVLYPRCAGLDVHKDGVVAAVRLAAAGAVKTEVRTFETTTPGLLTLSGWLAEHGCDTGEDQKRRSAPWPRPC